MANDLSKVRDYLFETLDYISDRDIQGDELKSEIRRAEVIANVATQITDISKVQLNAFKFATEYGVETPKIFIEEKEDGKKNGK